MIVTSLLQYLTFLLGSELLFLLPQSPKVYYDSPRISQIEPAYLAKVGVWLYTP